MQPRIETESEGRLLLFGQLDVNLLAELREQGREEIRKGAGKALRMDLAGAEFKGGAGLALLLAWLQDAREVSSRLTYHDAPAGLPEIIRLCGLKDILPLEDGAPGN